MSLYQSTRKKAQVTIFLVLGVLIVIIVGIFIYFSSSSKDKDAEEKIVQMEKIPAELEPIVNYMQKCIDGVAKRGVTLLGQQAGVIYSSQGGYRHDYEDYMNGDFFLEYPNSQGVANVPYLINLPVGGAGCENLPPYYPTIIEYYPYGNEGNFTDSTYLSTKDYNVRDCFGQIAPLFLVESMKDLRYYVENEVRSKCTPSTLFPNYEFVLGNVTVDIEDKSSSLFFIVKFPMEITNKVSRTKKSLDTFSTSLKLSLSELVNFVNDIMLLDVSDPIYIIGQGISDKFTVHVERDVYNKDDLIMIDTIHPAYDGKKFTFMFARKNRGPVLEYVHNTTFEDVSLAEGPVTYDSVIHQKILAVDPDEDNASIHINFGEGDMTKELTKDTPYQIVYGDIVRGRILINISAYDGEYADYQTQNLNGRFVIQ